MDVPMKPRVRVVPFEGRHWVKVVTLSPEMRTKSPGRIAKGDKGLAHAVTIWLKRHVPAEDKAYFISGTPQGEGIGRWQREPGAGVALHVEVSHLPTLLGYVRRREATVKDRAVLTYAYANMQKEAT